MKFIKPSEISARILTLLDESDERVILVSPYIKIIKWYRFLKKVNGLKKRNITTKIYVRDDPENEATFQDLDLLGLNYKKIPYLHCKFYMNEKYGIATSMNLLLSSDINSLEMGYATETWTEYNELLEFYHRYIHIGEPVHFENIAGRAVADLNEIIHRIMEETGRTAKNSWFWLTENVLHISTGRNSYCISINAGYLRITAYLIFETTINHKSIQAWLVKKIGDLTSMKVEMIPGFRAEILQLSGQAHLTLESTSINGILEAEAAVITEAVIGFINATHNLVF
jgi:hypothetical protein